jgi:hypothetical protein
MADCLWRPIRRHHTGGDVKIMMSLVTLIYSYCFVSLYQYFVNPTSLSTSIKFGALFGFVADVIARFGSYVYMPISLL